MKTSLILFFTLLLSALASCPANYNPSDIRTGKKYIYPGYVVASTAANVDANIRGATTSYVYQFNTTINGSPQIAIGKKEII
jgi:ABC-type oligopeptide transport system substrate-binding subunit